MSIVRTWATVIFLLAVVPGCASDVASEAPPREITPSEDALGGAAYPTVESLVSDMRDRGVSCEGMKILDPPQESIKDFGLCFVEGEREFETDIYLFDDDGSRDAWHSTFAEYPDVHTLLGPNWFITSGSVAELERIAAAIGGEVDPHVE